MGRNSLVLVDKDELIKILFQLLREYRTDVPDEYHRQDAEELAESLIQPSF